MKAGGAMILGSDKLGLIKKEQFNACEKFLGELNWTSSQASTLAKIALTV